MADLPPNETPKGGFPPPPAAPPPGGFAPPPGSPIYGANPQQGVQYAPWALRVGASLIEFGMMFGAYIAIGITSAIVGSVFDALGLLILMVGYLAMTGVGFYFAYMTGQEGASPGKKLLGLRVISEQTGQPIGGGLGIVRGIAHMVDGMICGVGYLFPLWDPKSQTLSDKIMSTIVVTGAPKQPFGPEVFKVSGSGM